MTKAQQYLQEIDDGTISRYIDTLIDNPQWGYVTPYQIARQVHDVWLKNYSYKMQPYMVNRIMEVAQQRMVSK